MSLTQMRGKKVDKKVSEAISAISTIIESQWLDAGSRRSLQSFLQSQEAAKASDDDDFALDQPQAKQVAYESSSGNIVQTVEDMQGKAEDTLSELRKKEMEESQAFQMLEAGLISEIEHSKEKPSTNTKAKAEAEQKLEEANGGLVE